MDEKQTMEKQTQNKKIFWFILILLLLPFVARVSILLIWGIDLISIQKIFFPIEIIASSIIGFLILYMYNKNSSLNRYLAIIGAIMIIPIVVDNIIFLYNFSFPIRFSFHNSGWAFMYPQRDLLFIPTALGFSTWYLGKVFRNRNQVKIGQHQLLSGFALILFNYLLGWFYYVPVTIFAITLLVSVLFIKKIRSLNNEMACEVD
jgi:hypothetical protein